MHSGVTSEVQLDAVPPTRAVSTRDELVVRYCLYGSAGGLRLLVFHRPGSGGSDRRPGRSVADVVDDVADLAVAEGWDRLAVAGGRVAAHMPWRAPRPCPGGRPAWGGGGAPHRRTRRAGARMLRSQTSAGT